MMKFHLSPSVEILIFSVKCINPDGHNKAAYGFVEFLETRAALAAIDELQFRVRTTSTVLDIYACLYVRM